jgi:hypothetical protein
MPLADRDDARALFALFGRWFGPPVLVFRSKLIDGRKRAVPFRALFHEDPPTHVARDELEVVRFLVAVEHYDRALEHLPQSVAIDNQLASLLLLEPARVAPLVALARHTGRRSRDRRKRRRTSVVVALRDLYVASLEGHSVTPEDLRDALGEWL